jgi:signal transduction histidine kinase
VACCLLLTCLAIHAQTIELTTADFVLDAAASPPADSAPWHALRLPDNWNLSRRGEGGIGWYRLRVDLPVQPKEPYALYIPKLSMNAAIYVNCTLGGSGGSFDEPVARHWNRPQLFVVPGALLRAGTNVLHVRLRAYANSRGGLGPMTLGPEPQLRPRYERLHFMQTILPQLCNIVIAAIGLFAFALWVRRRREPTYVLFFVFSVLWALRSTHMIVRDVPVNTFWWDVWVQSSFGWCALLFVALAMRYCGLRWPRFDKALIVYGAIGPVLMIAAGPAHLHAVASNWSFVIVPVAIFFEGFLVREALRQRTTASILLAIAWALIILASIHDGLVHRDRLAFDSFYFVSYAMVPLSLVMGWILTDRFVQALNVAEKLNVELEQRVAAKHAELAQNFQRLQQMERAKALAEERERLTSEMHDGLGSQLIAALHLVEQPDTPGCEIAEALRECLDSLRLTIHSLEPADDDLLAVLGSLRYRMEARLCRRGIALAWQVRDLPRLPGLTPQCVLHVLRILQEAFTNVARHARATTITVRTGATTEHVFIEVCDDGRGLANATPGRGIASMQARALKLGGRLQIDPQAQGTRVRLCIPLRREIEAAGHGDSQSQPADVALDIAGRGSHQFTSML